MGTSKVNSFLRTLIIVFTEVRSSPSFVACLWYLLKATVGNFKSSVTVRQFAEMCVEMSYIWHLTSTVQNCQGDLLIIFKIIFYYV